MSDLVQARWTCAYPVDIPGQGVIAPGDLAMVPKAEARDSDHWEPTRKTALLDPESTDTEESS